MATGINTYVDFPGPGGFTFRVFLEETYDVAGNYSYAPVTGISAQAKTYGGTWYLGGTVSVAGAVLATMDYHDPATHLFTVGVVGDKWYSVSAIQGGKSFPWATGKIYHNADGSKTIEVSVNITLWRKSGDPTFTISGTKSVNLTQIPRASGISGSAGTLGLEHTLTLTRYANNFTHTLVAVCGKESLTIATGVKSDTAKWTPPIDWAAQNTTGISVKMKITCTTYNGSEEVGSTSVILTFAIPSSVVPTARISVSDKQGYFSKYGNYIQGKSQAQISASGDGAYGSTISSYSVVCGNTTKTGASPVFDLPTAGEIKFTVTVTDSRGRTASTSVSISVVAYSSPTATILAAYRSDADGNQDDNGTYATVVFKANITSLGNKNSAKYSVKYRIKGTTVWTSVEVTTQAGNYAPEGVVQVVPIQLDSSYELSVSAADDFSAVDSLYRTVQVAFFLISFHRATKAVGIGQKATEPGTAAFGIPAKFNAGVIADGKTLTFVYNESVGGYVLMETIT